MKECCGSLLSCIGHVQVLCVNINLYVKPNGENYISGELSRQLTNYVPNAFRILGSAIVKYPNSLVYPITVLDGTRIYGLAIKPAMGKVFPNKSNVMKQFHNRVHVDSSVPGWMLMSDLSYIKNSLIRLVALVDQHDYFDIALSRPGCGHHDLKWNNISNAISCVLDDRFSVYY